MKRVLVASAFALALALGGGTQASAHAGFVSSDPADGASLPANPAAITIVFTETPDLSLTDVRLLDAGGAERALGPLTSPTPRAVTAPVIDPVPDGVYTVTWRVVSTEDGHVTAGAFAFGVGAAPAPEPGTGEQEIVTAPTPLSVASKTALYVGIALLLAAGVVGLWAFGGRPARLHVLGVAGAVLAFVGATGLLVAEERAVGASMADLVASPTGRPFVLMVATTLVAAAAAVLAAARPAWRPLLWVATAAAAVAAFLRASSGHAAAADPALVQESLQWAHMVAAGIWIGGLVLLVVLLREPGEVPVELLRRYSRMALVAVGVVVLTGAVRATTQLGGPGALIDALGTGYGRALFAKVALAAVLIGLGAVNRARSLPRLAEDARPLRRVATTEMAVASGVFVLTAALTGLNPPDATNTAEQPVPTLGVAEGTDFATTTHVALTATPGTRGANAFHAIVTDPDDGQPLDPDEVVLRFASATRPDLPSTDVALAPAESAWVGQGTALSVAGTWEVTARVLTGAGSTEVHMVLVTRSGAGTDPVPGTPFTTVSYPSGVSLQLSVEDAEGSTAFVHVTSLAPDGSELPLEDVVIAATPAGDLPQTLEAELVSAGHAIAQATLEPGEWTFDAVVTASDGRAFQATVVDVPLA